MLPYPHGFIKGRGRCCFFAPHNLLLQRLPPGMFLSKIPLHLLHEQSQINFDEAKTGVKTIKPEIILIRNGLMERISRPVRLLIGRKAGCDLVGLDDSNIMTKHCFVITVVKICKPSYTTRPSDVDRLGFPKLMDRPALARTIGGDNWPEKEAGWLRWRLPRRRRKSGARGTKHCNIFAFTRHQKEWLPTTAK